ncbi:MAG: glycoside hydrolase family 127 protein [Thalassovita sp.]
MTQQAQPHSSPFVHLKPLKNSAVDWTDGFWKQKQELMRDASLTSVLDALDDPENATYFGNFKNAAKGKGPFYGRFWSDGDCYKTIETMLLMVESSPDEKLSAKIEEMIEDIEAAQEDDGYLNTQITLSTTRGRWTDIEHHEIYNFGHLFTVGVLHKQVTGQDRLLNIAIRAADYLYETFVTRDPDKARFGFNPSQIMGLVELFRETAEQRYLELARIFVENRGAHPDLEGNNGDQSQMRVPLLDETEAVGHAVTGPYLWAGAADIVMETNETELLDAITRIWEDSTYRKMYITGGVGALHKGASERSHPRYEAVSEAYGRPFQLPNDTAYNETCANISKAMWSWRMLQLTGNARYADVMERVMYNTGLSGVSLSGTHFTYSNPLRFNGEKQFIGNNDSPRRWTRWTCYCCPPQVTRTIAGVHRWAYSTAQDATWVHLYGSNTLNDSSIGLTQTSDFPWSGDVSITVTKAPKGVHTLHLRIPAWSQNSTLTVNGAPIAITETGAHYVAVTRSWAEGDTIALGLDMTPQIVVGKPDVEEIRNQCAVISGPVVYCLEGADLPEGVNVQDVALGAKATLTPREGQGLFAGMTLLDVRLSARSDWTSPELYLPLASLDTQTVQATLIPYYAWNNRDDNTMAVWLPLDTAT